MRLCFPGPDVKHVEPQMGERVKEFGEDWTLVVMSLGRERD